MIYLPECKVLLIVGRIDYMDNLLEFKKHDDNQELEMLDYELSQIINFNQLSEKQRVKLLKGKDVQEVLDEHFKVLNKIRKSLRI